MRRLCSMGRTHGAVCEALAHTTGSDGGERSGRGGAFAPAVRGGARAVVVEWNATQAAFAQDRCIHELFEEQVRRKPQAMAVVHEGERLSYGELNERANQLAHHLLELGVLPDARVAICVERSAEMVVACWRF